MKRIRFVWAIAATAAVANAACTRCDGEKAAPPAAAAPAKAAPGEPESAEAEPEAPPRAEDAGAQEAKGPVGPVPDRLRGVWEKIDQPFKGMRIEFGDATGMSVVPVVAPPAADAEAVAFYTQKNGNNKGVGEQFATCMPKIWKAGVGKYVELKPTARAEEWVGSTELRIVHIGICGQVRGKPQDVVLRLGSDEELVATVVDPKSRTAQIETWKRVKP